jgi:hypothetical protein
LVLTQRDKNDVAVIDPDLFPELTANKTETLDAVEALRVGVSFESLRYEGFLRLLLTMASSLPLPNIFKT